MPRIYPFEFGVRDPAAPEGAIDVIFDRHGATDLPSPFTWLNQDTSTYIEKYGWGEIKDSTNGSHWTFIRAPAPAGNLFRITADISVFTPGPNQHHGGVCVRQATGANAGRIVGLALGNTGAGQTLRYNTWASEAGDPGQGNFVTLSTLGHRLMMIVERTAAATWKFGAGVGGASLATVLTDNGDAHLDPAEDWEVGLYCGKSQLALDVIIGCRRFLMEDLS